MLYIRLFEGITAMTMTRTNLHLDDTHRQKLGAIQQEFNIPSVAEACRFVIERFNSEEEKQAKNIEILTQLLAQTLAENEKTFIAAKKQLKKLLNKLEDQVNE